LDYNKRFADDLLAARLGRAGAVLIEGVKGCGKTETARQVARSIAQMDVDEDIRLRMDVDPDSVLLGDSPRLIDEWQAFPQIWNRIRHEVDNRKQKGLYILTGSANPEERDRLHSGAGRFSIMRMRPMSLYEKGWSSGEVRLEGLMHGLVPKSETVPFNLLKMAEYIAIGGWPALLDAEVGDAQAFVRDYADLIAEVDLSRVSNKKRDPLKVKRLMQSLSRNTATMASVSLLSRDTGGSEVSVTDETIADYLEALERLMAYEPLPAWSTHIRSSATLRKAPKRHFTDPSLAAGILGLTAGKLTGDLKFFGFLFESLVIRDLRIYADTHGGQVYHYHDSANQEVDAIIEYPDGRWGAFEVKLGIEDQDAAAASLLAFAKKIDTEKTLPPAALTVVTGNGFAFRRKDGVNVVPILALTA
jgi:predicted AAA+ superfamily ATPase